MRTRPILKRLAPGLAAGLLVAVLPASPAGAAGPAVNGGGSSFVGIEIDAWRADVAKPPHSVTINYQSTGSSFGREGFINGTLDFGISDIQFQPAPGNEIERVKKARPNFTYIPISAGGVAFMYNLTDDSGKKITDLKLSARTVCGIYTGYITSWSDPAIVAETGHPMPNKTVYPVIRADGSGQSFVLSQYCISQAQDLYFGFIDKLNAENSQATFEKAPTSNWPAGWGKVRTANYTDGVADAVADASNGDATIGYVETGFAEQRHIPVAAVKNADGVYAKPDSKSVTNALRYATVRADGTHELNFSGKGADVYFPSTYSYLIAQTTGFDPAKGKTLGTFLNYSLTKGQEKADTLGYAPLSPNLIAVGLDETAKIPGAPKCEETAGCVRPSAAEVAAGGGTTGGGTGTTGGGGRTTATGGTTGATTGGTAGTGATGAGVTGAATGTAGGTTATTRPAGGTTNTTRRGSTTARSGSSASASAGSGANSAALPATGADPAVGPLGATGGEHAVLLGAGAALALGGEYLRRRHRRFGLQG